MCSKPILHYFLGRGRAEAIRFLLAAADVKFEEKFYTTKEEYDELVKSGKLMFQQTPMLEIDGINMVQTKAILSYIAAKYNLYGSNLEERAYIDMYVDGSADLLSLVLSYFFLDETGKEKQLKQMRDRALNRYLPVYEKALKDKEFLVGNKLSMADVHVLDTILQVEEFHCDILQDFAHLQAFKKRMCEIPTIKKHLQPGSKRKPMADTTYVQTVMKLVHN